MTKWLCAIASAALLAAATGAWAQSTDAVGVAQKALIEALQKTPLSLPVALFIEGKAGGYGLYDARPSNHFKAGEPLVFYVEPLGYKYKRDGDIVTFGASMDVTLTSAGKTLYHKDDFLTTDLKSHHANAELDLVGTLNLTGAAPGDYVLEIVVRDHSSADVALTQLPFTIE
jgi:hypothetical protein